MARRKGLEAKLAQMFIVGLPGSELDRSSAEFLSDYQPGGVIYFAHNYETPALLAEMSEAVQDTRDRAQNLPLFIGVDHEGGRVQRFKRPFTHFPEPAQLGEIRSPRLAFMVAEVMARRLGSPVDSVVELTDEQTKKLLAWIMASHHDWKELVHLRQPLPPILHLQYFGFL